MLTTEEVRSRKIVVAYGGGLNSTAALMRMVELGIVPLLILFADTGGERPETYSLIQRFSAWLESKGFPAIIIVRKGGMQETLEENCLRKNTLPSIAYGFKSCSEKYKIRAQDKFTRHHPGCRALLKSGGKLVKMIGYDAGEERRAKILGNREYEYWYPLIEWGWHREECEEIARRYGFVVPKSSCFFCPSMRKPEILDLQKNHPDLMARALAMEVNAQLTTVKGLGRRFSWREFLEKANAGTPLESDPEPERPCGCYDG